MQAANARQQERAAQHLHRLAGALELLAPQRTLERGYAVMLDGRGKAVRSPSQLRAGAAVEVHLANGVADVGIASVQPKLADL